ncbi:hypothetical protein ABZ635_08675 [Nocardiopsis sp. NPDC007018]|uniref:hypothetical protein n=1 Tax=Nocardiopsis sp. NPDC007018 TaxID=3155721 RepID=UPI0033E3E4FE
MHINIPGRPEDLPPFPVLWARAATLAALEAGGCKNQHAYADSVVHHDDAGGNEWRLTRVQGGRGVLVGIDHECGPPFDESTNLYDGPDWLPWTWLAELEDRREQGLAYWWDGESWDRVDYSDDAENDGLDLLLTHVSTARETVTKVLDFLDLDPSLDEGKEELVLIHRVLELAEKGTGGEEEWQRALDAVLGAARRTPPYEDSPESDFDVAAALAVARSTGLVRGSRPETKEAGNGRPKDWDRLAG